MNLRAIVCAVALMLTLPGVARAVTVEDVVALSKAGVADSVLVAVIDADRTIFTLSPQQIIDLRNAGVSNAVLVKMLGSAREFGEPPASAATSAPVTAAPPYVAPTNVTVDAGYDV